MKRSYIYVILLLSFGLILLGCGESDGPLQVKTSPNLPTGPNATAVVYEGNTAVVDLIAGRTIVIGSVECTLDGHNLQVKYLTHGGWLLRETQLAIAKELSGIPTNPVGLPVIGHFPFKNVVNPPDSACTWSVDLDAWELYEADSLFIAAHAEVGLMSPAGEWIQEEGAWGIGQEFSRLAPDGTGSGKEGKIEKVGGHGNWASYLTVNLWRLKGLLLWNKLGSAAEVQHSRVGPNGVIVGSIEYLPGTYGSGFKPLPRTGDPNVPDNYIKFYGLNLPPRGCIEFWYQPDWIDPQVGHCVDLFYYMVPEKDEPWAFGMYVPYNDWQDRLHWHVWDPYPYEVASKFIVPSVQPGWTTTEPFHIAFIWDGSAPDLADRASIFIDGVEVTYQGAQPRGDPDFTGWSPEMVLFLGSRGFSGDWYRHHWEGSTGTIDNIKIWNYPKTDFSDRFVE